VMGWTAPTRHRVCHDGRCRKRFIKGAPSMDKTTTQASVATIGIDLGKKVFQVHGIDSCGKIVVRRAVKRRELVAFAAQLAACVLAMEGCATAPKDDAEQRLI